MEINCGIHNRWDVVVRDAKTGKAKKAYKGFNIILNSWWARYISNNVNTCTSYIHFGSGTDTPVATNTKLKTPTGSKTAGNLVTNFDNWKSDGIISMQKSCRLEANEYNGQAISEMGFSHSGTTSANLLTHSLVKDANGNPLSIMKNADEVVDIYGTVFFHIGFTFDGGKMGFVSKDSQIIVAIMTDFGWSIGSTDTETGIARQHERVFGSSRTDVLQNFITLPSYNTSYNASEKKVTITSSDFAVAYGNIVGGIGSLFVRGFQICLPCTGFLQPAIIKEVVGTGDGSVKDFQTKFGYIKNNGTFKVYVNDIEVSATADFNRGYPASNSLAPYVKYLPESTSYAEGNPSGEIIAFENPYHADFGITSISITAGDLFSSDDAETWESVSPASNIPAGHRNKRYFKAVGTGSTFKVSSITSNGFSASQNVHLASAPASGATVAVTYQPDVLAKDDQHTVKNISVTFSFNEYTP